MLYRIWLVQDCGGGHYVKGYLTDCGELTSSEEGAVTLTLGQVAEQLPDLSYEHTSLLECKIEAI